MLLIFNNNQELDVRTHNAGVGAVENHPWFSPFGRISATNFILDKIVKPTHSHHYSNQSILTILILFAPFIYFLF